MTKDTKLFEGIPLSDLGQLILRGAILREVIDLLVESHGSKAVLAAIQKHRKKPKIRWAVYAVQIGTVDLVKAVCGLRSDKGACDKIARILSTTDAQAVRQRVVRARAALKGTRYGTAYQERSLEEEMHHFKKSGASLETWVRRTKKYW